VDRKAIRMDGSMEVTSCGPCGYEDPAGSIIVKRDANSLRRKDKGSSAMIFNRGLVGPKPDRNSNPVNRETG
jgi:hypothetical protein